MCHEKPERFGPLCAPRTAIFPIVVRQVLPTLQRTQEKDGGTSSQPAHFGCDRRNNQCWASTAVQGKRERDMCLHLSVVTGSFPSSRLPKTTQLMPEINLPKEDQGRTGGCNGPQESAAQRFNHLPRLEQLSCGNHFDINLSATFLSEINGA